MRPLNPYRAPDPGPPSTEPDRYCAGCLHPYHHGECNECGSVCLFSRGTATFSIATAYFLLNVGYGTLRLGIDDPPVIVLRRFVLRCGFIIAVALSVDAFRYFRERLAVRRNRREVPVESAIRVDGSLDQQPVLDWERADHTAMPSTDTTACCRAEAG